jgi:hypothetical protein
MDCDPNLGHDILSGLQNCLMNLFITDSLCFYMFIKSSFFVNVITCSDIVAMSA